MSSHSLLVYRVRNLGDMIQTAALSRMLPRAAGVFRHRLDEASEERLLIVNGVLHKERPPTEGATCLFAGVSGPYWRHKEYAEWLGRSPYPIGGRDQCTVDAARLSGHDAVLIGCATMTFPRYEGDRSGVYSVDYSGPGTSLTHWISRKETVSKQWSMAMEHLSQYRTAEAVYTSRLHVALPCLAYGTPVFIANPHRAWKPERFSVIEELGIPYDRLVTADLSEHSQRYIEFLESTLNIPIEPDAPTMPEVADSPVGILSRLFRWSK